MANYYLDIETTGLDPATDSIITIQYQELGRRTGSPKDSLQILKAWDGGEAEMLERFARDAGIDPQNRFAFVPVGYNLSFEHSFLHAKAGIDILGLPNIDLHHTAILMNRGEFRGSGLDKMTGKPHGGGVIPEWYREGLYGNIVRYVEREAEEFIKFYEWLLERLPAVHREFVDGRPAPERALNATDAQPA